MNTKKIEKLKNNNKGFTLVELIVVLIILAILAAILVPALIGYIDEAKKKQDVIEAKSCYTALQSELAITYGLHPPKTETDAKKKFNIFTYLDKSEYEVKDENVFLNKQNKISEFTQNVFNKMSIEKKPYCIIMYTIRVDDIHNKPENLKQAYSLYSIVYWRDKNSRPIFYNPDTNDWEEGSPYTAGYVLRGTKARPLGKEPNEVINGKFKGKCVTPYVVWRDLNYSELNTSVTEINKKINIAMGLPENN